MPKQHYWIVDVEGNFAQVEGAEQRDEWIQVRGWREAAEPGPTDQVHVANHNPEIRPGRLPYAALGAGLDGYGWHPGPPPAPIDATKDPALTPVVEPVKTKTSAAAGAADKKE